MLWRTVGNESLSVQYPIDSGKLISFGLEYITNIIYRCIGNSNQGLRKPPV